MEIYIPSLPALASQVDVERSLRQVLHGPIYSPDTPINFHVAVFKSRQGTIMGNLCLPSPLLTRQFLSNSPSVSVLGQPIMFRRGNRTIDNSILHRITTTPYEDPRVAEERAARINHLNSQTILLHSIQFPWLCRDGSLSIEWQLTSTSARTLGSLSFLHAQRQIQITAEHSNFILIPYSSLRHVSAHEYPNKSNALFLSLYTPPLLVQCRGDDEAKYIRRRRAYLPLRDSVTGRPHSDISRYLLLSIRLICASADILSKFKMLCSSANLKLAIHDIYYPVVERNLFSMANIEAGKNWRSGIPFLYQYLTASLVMSHAINPWELLLLRPDIESLICKAKMKGTKGEGYAIMVLREFERRATAHIGSNLEEAMSLRQCFLDSQKEYDAIGNKDVLTKRDDNGIFLSFHLIVTPSQYRLEGPYPERSNHVIRRYSPLYHSNFLRVSFVEEGKLMMHHSKDYDVSLWTNDHVRSLLVHGLEIGTRKFSFLAYSQSSLRQHSVWFISPFTLPSGGVVDAASIIRRLGTFDDELTRQPALFGARISQGFTTTDPTTTKVEHIITINDIKRKDPTTGRDVNFTDGCGTMSPEFARSLHAERQAKRRGLRLHLRDYPAAIQIRFLGSKGMLSIDHRLSGLTVCLRDSMIKFTGRNSNKIEVAKVFDKPNKFYLNRPLIMLLEGLGVSPLVFVRYQKAAIQSVHESTKSIEGASFFLESQGLGTSFRFGHTLLRLARLSISMPSDDFFITALHYSRNDALRELKQKARIPIHGAWNLVGVADVYDFLKANEIYVCIRNTSGELEYLEGPTLITRSPTIHPGDAQIVTAIGCPSAGTCYDIEPLPNTVVFSCQGNRPLCSYLGGGDLDGDEYNVIPLKLHPGFRIRNNPPSAYLPPHRLNLGRRCTPDDIANFVTDYIVSDNLGYISITWLMRADIETTGIFHPDCLKLAELANQAVDFPKTGNPVPMGIIPKRPDLIPDWNAPETVVDLDPDKYYKSTKALGLLFRAIDLPAADTVDVAMQGRQRRGNGTDDDDEDQDLAIHLDDAFSNGLDGIDHDTYSTRNVIAREVIARLSAEDLEQVNYTEYRDTFLRYQYRLKNICSVHTLSRSRGAMLTEEEAFVGTIVAGSSQPAKRLNHTSKMREETEILVGDVRDIMFGVNGIITLRRAYGAWLFAKQEELKFGGRSFGWIVLGVILDALDIIDEERRKKLRARIRRSHCR